MYLCFPSGINETYLPFKNRFNDHFNLDRLTQRDLCHLQDHLLNQ